LGEKGWGVSASLLGGGKEGKGRLHARPLPEREEIKEWGRSLGIKGRK